MSMTTSSATGSQAIQALLDSVNGTNSSSSASSQSQKTNTTSDMQNQFLTLLTTQLKYQDPLNPVDNAQMTSQMAQISTVDGINQLNATLQQLMTSNANTQIMKAAALVNHQVMVAGSGLQLTDAGAVGGVELGANADQVTVTIKDANGQVVDTETLGALDAGVHNFIWDGKTATGAQAANGNYSISISATSGGKAVDATALQMAGVLSANNSSQGVSLNLGALGLATLADIKQVF